MAGGSRRRRTLPRLGLGTVVVAVPSALADYARPGLGTDVLITGATVVLAALITMLMAVIFGSARVSERVFRLLRIATGRPEPDPPTPPAAQLSDSAARTVETQPSKYPVN